MLGADAMRCARSCRSPVSPATGRRWEARSWRSLTRRSRATAPDRSRAVQPPGRPLAAGVLYPWLRALLEVGYPWALWAVDEIEGDRLSLLQGVEVDQGHLGAVKEGLGAVVGANKAKTAVRDDLLNSASGHFASPSTDRR